MYVPRRMILSLVEAIEEVGEVGGGGQYLRRDLARILFVVAILDDALVAPHRRKRGLVLVLCLLRSCPLHAQHVADVARVLEG